MINKIIDGISLKLNEEFNDEYKIYTEEVKQGLKTPCFFINALDPSEELYRDNRYYQTNTFCVQYLPNTNNSKIECNDIRDRLFSILEYITIKETEDTDLTLIRGNNMHGEYTDNMLNFFVNYNMFVVKEKEIIEKMNDYDYDNQTRG